METRKVQINTNNQLFIYIPKSISKELKINKGDILKFCKRGDKHFFEKVK